MKYGIYYNGYLKQTGGPNGYLYNLNQGYEHIENKVDFIVLNSSCEQNHTDDNVSFIKKRIQKISMRLYLFLTEVVYFKNTILKTDDFEVDNISEYDCLHCHTVLDAYRLRYKKKYAGKIILTPHCPEPYSIETRDYLRNQYKKTGYDFNLVHKVNRYVEKMGYSAADGYIFPCKEAMEIYESFPFFKEKSNGKIFKYLVTGLPYSETAEFSEKHDCLKLLYVGRHNKIKGYDFLVNNYKKILKEGVLTVAGANDGIIFPDDEKWIELGWRTDVKEIIEDNDIFILPNYNTYFDLIALEVMASKRIILASNTGGNRYLSKKSKGVILFERENIDDLVDKIRYIKAIDETKYKEMQISNYHFIESNCRLEIFASNHYNLISDFMSEWNKSNKVKGVL